MLTPYEEAFELLIQRVERLSTEKVLLWNALGRVLAEDVYADRDNPAFDSSAMDGYAIRSEDLENLPARLKVIGEVPAGGEWKGVVERGCAFCLGWPSLTFKSFNNIHLYDGWLGCFLLDWTIVCPFGLWLSYLSP